ncbi:hypothetical protein LCGC14_2878720 [marine sediment metagenome]|uniref:Uncharacterized protein n=1 Tax=marine sediment metagenome TaxID=412755 RepID=A0A0F8Y0Q0_9ZZZZ
MLNVHQDEIKRTVATHRVEFENRFGIGPCGAVAVVLRERGLGHVVYAEASGDPTNAAGWFGHYLIRSFGKLVALTNPFNRPLVYRDVQRLDSDELPELMTAGCDEVNFWRERLS